MALPKIKKIHIIGDCLPSLHFEKNTRTADSAEKIRAQAPYLIMSE